MTMCVSPVCPWLRPLSPSLVPHGQRGFFASPLPRAGEGEGGDPAARKSVPVCLFSELK
jgi:hypothetical protein